MNTNLLPANASPTRANGVTRLLIVDDHPVFRHGISQVLSEQDGLSVCAEAHNAHSALEAMRQHKPDIALLDVTLPGTNGIELTKLMVAEQPKLIILIL